MRQTLRILLAGAVVSLGLSQFPCAARQEPDLARVEGVLERTADQPVAAVGRSLAALGNDAIPALFELLACGRTAASQPALLYALEHLPLAAVREVLVGRLHGRLDDRTRCAALSVLAVIGGAEELRLAIAFATPDREQLAPRPLRLAFAEALERILQGDPRGIHVLEDEYATLHLSLAPVAVRAIAGRDTHSALRVLVGLLDSVPGSDVLILCEVARLGREAPKPVDEDLRRRVLGLLDSADRATLTEAVHATGALECAEAVEALIDLLAHEALGVREAALRALRGITGVRIDRDPEHWRLWYEREQSWWNEDGRALLEALHSPLPSTASTAILELAGHTLFRHEIAAALAHGLRRSEHDLVLMSCAALGQLRSEISLPALIELLAASTESEPRQAALRALVRITGRDHGSDPDSWRSALDAEGD